MRGSVPDYAKEGFVRFGLFLHELEGVVVLARRVRVGTVGLLQHRGDRVQRERLPE